MLKQTKSKYHFLNDCRITEQERKERLEEQAKTNEYHRFTEGNLILKQGFIDKRKVGRIYKLYYSIMLVNAYCFAYSQKYVWFL